MPPEAPLQAVTSSLTVLQEEKKRIMAEVIVIYTDTFF